jgi:hypothetical protein
MEAKLKVIHTPWGYALWEVSKPELLCESYGRVQAIVDFIETYYPGETVE